VTPDNRENIELVNEKAKAGYTTGYADPEFIGDLPCSTCRSCHETANTERSALGRLHAAYT
jgi:hypothetical protein